MRKLIAVAVAVLVIGLCAASYAETATNNVTVRLPVTGNFGFYTWESDELLTDAVAGDTGALELHVIASSNHDRVWNISANCAGLVGETQVSPDTLPVIADTADVVALPLTGVDQVVFTAQPTEYTCSEFNIGSFWLTIPTTATTKQDLYSGTVLLTMTD